MRAKCKTAFNSITTSDLSEVDFGTPQGSCLGPLLFTIFTNDLTRHLVHTKCILFADDTTIYMCHKNPTYLKWCIEDDLSMLSDWFKANLLTLNVEKSVCMMFKPRSFKGSNKFAGFNISLGNAVLPSVDSTKFLGVWLDSKLNWSEHLSKLFIKLKKNLSLLKLSKNHLTTHAKSVFTMHKYTVISPMGYLSGETRPATHNLRNFNAYKINASNLSLNKNPPQRISMINMS